MGWNDRVRISTLLPSLWAVIELGFLAALQAVIVGFDSLTVHTNILANGTAWCGRPPVTRDIDGIVTHIGRQVFISD